MSEHGGARSRWFRRGRRHTHDWTYGPRTSCGWGIARCACGEWDLYQ